MRLKLVEQVQHSYEEATGRHEVVPEPGELLADWSAIDARLARATNLVQLAIDEPRRRRAVAGERANRDTFAASPPSS